MGTVKQRSRTSSELKRLQPFLEQIGSVAPDGILSGGRGRTFYHYTDLPGLQGVVTQHDLWLTNSRYSNDNEEMVHGYRIARKIVESEAATGRDPFGRDYLQHLKDLLDKPRSEAVYICCFCEKDNLLSQWRGYAANGTGVSIQIEAQDFAAIAGGDMPLGLMRFWKVFYDLDAQREIVRQAVQFGRNSTNDPEGCAQIAADAIEFFIPTFKNPDFSEESEWRLIFTPAMECPVPPSFRISRQVLTPYYSLRGLTRDALPKLPIKHILVGPSPNQTLNLLSVGMLLENHGYDDIPVEASPTPYRG